MSDEIRIRGVLRDYRPVVLKRATGWKSSVVSLPRWKTSDRQEQIIRRQVAR